MSDTPFGPMTIEEVKPEPPALPLRLVGLEPGRDRKVHVIDIESIDHALFVLQEAEEKGAMVATWIEDANGMIIMCAEELYATYRRRLAEIAEKVGFCET